MPQVLIQIGQSIDSQYSYFLSQEKIKYLLKFVDAIVDETETESDLLKEIEIGLKEVQKIRKGELPRRTLKQMINGD